MIWEHGENIAHRSALCNRVNRSGNIDTHTEEIKSNLVGQTMYLVKSVSYISFYYGQLMAALSRGTFGHFHI